NAILRNCQASMMIIMPEAKRFAQVLKSQVETLRYLLTMEDLSAKVGFFHEVGMEGGDTAFLQYTSGSTGNPKGVIITHANVLANIRTMGDVVHISPQDVIVSWLPLYHDMGLIGTWLSSLYFALPLVLMSPLSFISKPKRWLWSVHRHRGTVSAAPNFAYELCLKRIQDNELQGLDLSSWRIACNGAEPVSPSTAEQFCRRFSAYGFRRETFMPVYGLAESTVGLCFPPLHREPLVDQIKRNLFMEKGQAVPADEDDISALRFVACGRPLPRHEIRIVDANGRELPERYEDTLQFRGPSSTSGYYRNPEETKKLLQGEWLDSGDYAYVAGGDVFITGRKKDMIIRSGRNVYPQELEEAVSGLPGIRKGNVVVFGTSDPETDTEQLIVVAETREEDPGTLEALKKEINALTIDLTGMAADDIFLAKPGTVLKTSSGKIRRAANRALYKRGQIGRRHLFGWWPFVRIILGSIFPELRRIRQAVTDFLYANYCRIVYGLLAPFTWLFVVLLPSASLRWKAMRSAVWLLTHATFTKITVYGSEKLISDRPCIYVSNHASYLDSYVMVAILPPEFSFVAKRELAGSFINRLPLNRVKTEFVERSSKKESVEDGRRLSLTARKGRSLFFFAEGTFTSTPGLLPFHMGAFLVAAEAGLPVVPIAIRGTRNIMPGSNFFPRHGMITVTIGKPIEPLRKSKDTSLDAWDTALILRDLAREHILRHCGEPDLT
ncbi:MAG: AMP-binding protein, partial [Syntrophaceae bacterium]|nr:AMP-binding protein [Syntrophaceae bacterium]